MPNMPSLCNVSFLGLKPTAGPIKSEPAEKAGIRLGSAFTLLSAFSDGCRPVVFRRKRLIERKYGIRLSGADASRNALRTGMASGCCFGLGTFHWAAP